MLVAELARLEEHVVNIHLAENKAQLKTTLLSAIRWLGFDDLAISVNRRDASSAPKMPDICSRDEPFLGIYQRRRKYEGDPQLQECLTGSGPMWVKVDVGHQHPFVRELSEFFLATNIRSAAFIPLPAKKGLFSGMVATGSRDAGEQDDVLRKFAILARASMMKLELLRSPPCDQLDNTDVLTGLTEQQVEILRWASEGKSNTSIAVITGLSKAGVDYHFRAIISKLGVASRTQAVALFAKCDSAVS